MEILGIGLPELLLILLVALLVLGPKDMVKAGRTLGKMMRAIVLSPTWATLNELSRELRGLPTRLIREAGIEEEELKDLKREVSATVPRGRELRKQTGFDRLERDYNQWQKDLSPWTTPPQEESIQPPSLTVPGTSEEDLAGDASQNQETKSE